MSFGIQMSNERFTRLMNYLNRSQKMQLYDQLQAYVNILGDTERHDLRKRKSRRTIRQIRELMTSWRRY